MDQIEMDMPYKVRVFGTEISIPAHVAHWRDRKHTKLLVTEQFKVGDVEIAADSMLVVTNTGAFEVISCYVFPIRDHGRIPVPTGNFEWIKRGIVARIKKRTIDEMTVVLERGNILMWNETEGIFYIYKTLERARRGCIHTNAGYGYQSVFRGEGELSEMKEVSVRAMSLCFELGGLSQMTLEQEEKWRQRCAKLAQECGLPKHPAKVRLRDRAAKAAIITDSLGRPNMGVARNQLAYAAEDASIRIGDILEKAPRIDARLALLHREIARNQNLEVEAYATVSEALELTKQNLPHAYKAAAELLDGLVPKLTAIDDLPWRHNFARLLTDIKAAIVLLRNGRAGESPKFLERTLVSLEFLGELFRQFADLCAELAVEIKRHPRNEQKKKLRELRLRQLMERFEVLRDDIPVEITDGGDVEPGADKYFRKPLSPRIFLGLTKALIFWRRGDFDKVAAELDEIEFAF